MRITSLISGPKPIVRFGLVEIASSGYRHTTFEKILCFLR